MSSFRSDGKTTRVTAPYDVTKDIPLHADGWFGMTLHDADSGDIVALETEREHNIVVDQAVTAAKGDILYINKTTGVVNTTNSGSTKAFGKVTVAKDSNNNVSIKLLPQVTA